MIPLMKNTFHHEEEALQALSEFIASSPRLSMGPECAAFEDEFAASQDRDDCVLFNSGGSANLAMFQALKNLGRLENDQRVGFSALTWSTNVMPLLQLGLHPVPMDVDRKTLNVMLPQIIESHERSGLSAVFLTNVLGFCADLGDIREYCAKENILVGLGARTECSGERPTDHRPC